MKKRIICLYPLIIGIVPTSMFLFLIANIIHAVMGTFILTLCMLMVQRTYSCYIEYIMNYAEKSIPEMGDALKVVQDQTEKATIELVDILGNVMQKTNDSSEEAMAVVDYFIGASCDEKNPFGSSYITQMLNQNEAVLSRASSIFHDIGNMHMKLLENCKNVMKEMSGIHQFATEINKIAIQTKVLALNTAIEATRSGEKANGLSVIAEQIRNLSDQSDKMASNIAEIVETSKNTLETFHKGMCSQITDEFMKMENIEQEMNETFGALKKGIDNISDAIAVVTLNYQTIAKEIRGVIVSLQYQDITSQELSRVISSMFVFRSQLKSIQVKAIQNKKSEKKSDYVLDNKRFLENIFGKKAELQQPVFIPVEASLSNAFSKVEKLDNVVFFN